MLWTRDRPDLDLPDQFGCDERLEVAPVGRDELLLEIGRDGLENNELLLVEVLQAARDRGGRRRIVGQGSIDCAVLTASKRALRGAREQNRSHAPAHNEI
jgi:hypothetical protein